MNARLRLHLHAPVHSAYGMPLLVEILDDHGRQVAETAVAVGDARDFDLPATSRVTVLVTAPSGADVIDGVELPAGSSNPVHHAINVAPLARQPWLLRPAGTGLVRFGEAEDGGLDMREYDTIWLRHWRPVERTWTPIRRRAIRNGDRHGIRITTSGFEAGTMGAVQIGGASLPSRFVAVPPGHTVDVTLRARQTQGRADVAITVTGPDPILDTLMSLLTLGRLRQVRLIAESLRTQAVLSPAQRVALAYAGLLDLDRMTAIGPDADILRVARAVQTMDLSHDGPWIRDALYEACRNSLPLWTAGLKLLAATMSRVAAEAPDGLGPRLTKAWEGLRPLLAVADLTQPTVTYPGTAVGVAVLPGATVPAPADVVPVFSHRFRAATEPAGSGLRLLRGPGAFVLPDLTDSGVTRPRSGVLTAADGAGRPAEAMAWVGSTRLAVTHNSHRDCFELAASATAEGPSVLPVEYSAVTGDTQLIWLPLAPDHGGRARARARLDNLDPLRPIGASAPMAVSEIEDWDVELIRRSTVAAASLGTQTAWRSILIAAGREVCTRVDGDVLWPRSDRVIPPERLAELGPESTHYLALLNEHLPVDLRRRRDGEHHWADRAGLLSVTSHAVEPGTVQLRASNAAAGVGLLVQIDLVGPRQAQRYLLPLLDGGAAVLTVPAPSGNLRIVVAGLTDPADLDERQADVVARSVRAGQEPERKAWRQTALDRMFGDSIRSAIVGSLGE
ncbi:hypothetical protein [Micromonospora aurantiaca (nom. illeg.)]|uniref:hypothetical protein n=1 Tax=Micromonospora aurantiaca (nom. illeg.) TaxID=47850 RepID=UPI003EBEFACA